MNIREVINHFLIELRFAPLVETHVCSCYQDQELMTRQVLVSRGETSITLLNVQSIKQTPNDLSLYPYCSAVLYPH